MESGFYCPECLAQLVWLSTTRDEKYFCVSCDVRYTENEAMRYDNIEEIVAHRVASWEEPHYWDFVCPNCKSTQRIMLDLSLFLGQRGDKAICLNCREELVVRVPYSAFTK